MAGYSSLTQRESIEILSLYGFEADIQHLPSPMSQGISNSNYLVVLKNAQKVVLKISNDKSKEELNSELQLLEELAQKKFPYSLKAYLTQDHQSVYQWNNYIGAIFPFHEGESPKIDGGNLYQVGQALGTLHQLSFEKDQIRSFSSLGHDVQNIFQYEKISPFKQRVDQLFSPEKRKQITETLLPEGLLHGDLYYDNTLFKEEKLLKILDFEQFGWGSYLMDIGISISGSCLDQNKDIYPPFVNSFLQGYETQRKLASLERELLYDYILLGLCSISLWRIKRFIDKDIASHLKDSYLELLERAMRFKISYEKN